MSNSHWQIEHGCPQCGAPVTLDETDRILSCPFCRTRLFLVAENHFRYRIPPSSPGNGGELIYLPYWRLRGASFSVAAAGLTPRFVDSNILAVTLPGLSYSLGLRPQVLKLRFLSPTEEGRFIVADLPADQAIPDLETPPQGVFYRAFIGETVSLIYAPFMIRDGSLYDAFLGNPVSGFSIDALKRLPTAPASPEGQVRFVPTLCPHCGRDMQGEKDSLVLICRNCNSAWSCPEAEFTPVEFTVMTPPAGSGKIVLYIPFWRMKPRIGGMELHSYADLIRIANLPKAITPAFTAAPLHFWSPAFKVNPALYCRWSRQMTVFRPEGDADDRLPETDLYPVTLPLSEAAEGIIVTLADMIADKRKLSPKLAGLRISLEESRLEYHPFVLNRDELLHASMQVSLNRTALLHGVRM